MSGVLYYFLFFFQGKIWVCLHNRVDSRISNRNRLEVLHYTCCPISFMINNAQTANDRSMSCASGTSHQKEYLLSKNQDKHLWSSFASTLFFNLNLQLKTIVFFLEPAYWDSLINAINYSNSISTLLYVAKCWMKINSKRLSQKTQWCGCWVVNINMFLQPVIGQFET